MSDRGLILWDFDGTLGYRRCLPGLSGRSFASCLVELLNEHEPDSHCDPDHIRALLRQGLPWHRPEVPHPELTEPDAWWASVIDVLTRAYEGIGLGRERAATLARLAARRYVDPTTWRLYDDSAAVLRALAGDGWRHIILSNHVPELPAIVSTLGLGPLVEETLTSAAIGYEKPHPEAFAISRRLAGQPKTVWMVGDNAQVDVAGAEAVGIPAILVWRETAEPETTAKRVVRRLDQVTRWLT